MQALCLVMAVTLCAGRAGAEEARALFWWNDPVGPDDTVQVAGADLAGLTSVTVAVLDGQGVSSSPLPAEVVSVTPSMVKFILPKSLPKAVYRAVLTYPDTQKQILLNRPTVYWSQGDRGSTASPGGWVTVVGRNIARSAQARLLLTSSTGQSIAVAPDQADLWTARFALPAELPAGAYSAAIANGHGGAAGQSDAGTIEVAAVRDYGPSVISLKPSGADDSASLSEALTRLGTGGGGTVRLEAGLYRMTGPLLIPPHVAIEGVSREAVVLNWLDDGPALNTLISGKSDFSISNLTIYSNKLVNVIKAGLPEAADEQDGRNITLSGLTIRTSYLLGHLSPEDGAARMRMPDAFKTSTYGIVLAGADHRIIDCDVLTTKSPLLLMRPVNGLVRGNRFSIGRTGWYSITGANGLLVEGNRFEGIDLQSAGGGINTLDSSVTASQNILFRDNTFEHSFGWDREAMTTDGPGGFYSGSVVQTGPRSLELGPIDPKTTRPSTWTGSAMFVLGGKGMGQWARVAAREGQQVTLDRDLPVALDPSSEITIVPLQRRYVFVHNNFTDVGIALQTYGTALEHVIADNTMLRAGDIRVWGLVYKAHPQPAWFNQILDNTLAGANFDGGSVVSVRATQRNGSKVVLNTGTVVRGNVVDANGKVVLDGYSKSVIGLTNAIVEHNLAEGALARLEIGGGVAMNVMRQTEPAN